MKGQKKSIANLKEKAGSKKEGLSKSVDKGKKVKDKSPIEKVKPQKKRQGKLEAKDEVEGAEKAASKGRVSKSLGRKGSAD